MTTTVPNDATPREVPTNVDAPALAEWVSPAAHRTFDAHVRGSAQAFDSLLQARSHHDRENRAKLETMRAIHAVDTARQEIGGVPVDVVVPSGHSTELAPGVPVLMCLHGGGFAWGAGAGALLEAVPIAAVSGLPVVAVDYRMAPEHHHPAAIDDVIAVYRALLAERPASQVGLYGCSAGGVLVAQTLATLQAMGEPRPGAAAMMHGTGLELGGDLLALSSTLTGDDADHGLSTLFGLAYFNGAEASAPAVFPGEHPAVLAGFPPSLLITSTRDFAASSISVMHRRLMAAGVEAHFILFDGLWHAFHMSGDLPESQELYARVAEFFLARLR